MQHLQRSVAEPAFGHVDDALESEVIRRLRDHTQIGKGVTDFGAFIEARAANHAIGQPKLDKTVFEFAHLEGGPHQYRDLVERMVFAALARLALELLGLLADRARFLLAVPGAGNLASFAQIVFGSERLAETAFNVSNEMGCGCQDVTRRAVISLEPDDLSAGKIVLEPQDVVDLSAAPAIDRLVVIADAANVLGRAG